MKTIFAIIGFIVLVVVGFVAYILLTLDPAELGQKVIARVKEKTGLEMTAETFEVRPLEGLRLESGHLEGDLAAGKVTGELDRMALDYKLLAILQGEIVVHQILVEGAKLEWVSRPAKGSPEEGSPQETGTATLDEPTSEEKFRQESHGESSFFSAVSIDEFRVVDGNLQVSTEGSDSPDLVVQGFDLEIGDLSLDPTAASPFLGLAAKGGIRIEAIRLDEMTIDGGRGNLVVDRGRLAVTDLGVETARASLEVAEIAADLTQYPSPYWLRAGGSYDLNGLVEAETDGFGPAALEFSASGTGPNLDDMVAAGTFRLDSGEIPAFPMMVRIEKRLGKPLIVGYPYEGTDIVFSLAGRKAVIEPFVMGLENLQLACGGGIDLTGRIDLQIDIRLPREAVSISILGPSIDVMTDEDGWTTIPFNITGTMAEPSVDFDMTAVQQTAANMGKRAVGRALDSAVEEMRARSLQRRAKRDQADG